MATLGDTTVEASTDQWPAGYIVAFGVSSAAGGYQMIEAGTLTNININMVGATGDVVVNPCIYNDSSLAPATLFCTFDAFTVPAGSAAAWYQSGNPTATALLNGSLYWLSFIVTNQPGTGLSVTCKTSGAATGSCIYLGGQGTSVPSPFPGSPNTTPEVASIYVNYTPVGGSTPKSDTDSTGTGMDATTTKAVITAVD